MTKPRLVVLIGIPGSGKTYWAERLAKKLNAVHINSDIFRFSLSPRPRYSHQENIKLFYVIDFVVKELLQQRRSVIYDANILKKIYRKRLQALAKKSSAKFVTLHIRTPLKTALTRTARRHIGTKGRKKLLYRPIPEVVLQKYAQLLELPTNEYAILINGTSPFKVEWTRIRKRI